MPFLDFIGHDGVVSKLQTAIQTGKLSHAYLLEGPRGVGKSEIAKRFAGALLCGKADMCGQCASCKKMLAGSHPDLIWIDNSVAAKENKKSLSIDAIRFLKSDAFVKPFESRYKIYIIPDSDKMEPPAQNALLKILEEPPKYCTIILLCENKMHFLPTVLSRCTVFQLKRLTLEEIAQYAEKKYGQRPGELSQFEGLPRLVDLYLGDAELLEKKRDAISQLTGFLSGKSGIIPFSDYLESRKEELDGILEDYMTFVRDLCCYLAGCEISKEYLPDIERLGQKLNIENSMGIFDAIYQCKINLSRNANLTISVTMMLMAALEELNDRSNRSKI